MSTTDSQKYIVVTGAAGFIGSCLVGRLNQAGYADVVAVDDFSVEVKKSNLSDKSASLFIHRDEFHSWFRENTSRVAMVYHIGARTDTAEFDEQLLTRLNLDYSKQVWTICAEAGVPLVYASSAATYGAGEHGYADNHASIPALKPLNPYGWSKQYFDMWVLEQEKTPPFWAGLKFFNVYGPNEYHKGRMASVIFHAYHQILKNGSVKLFRSHRPEYRDGWQLRDFVYVKDVLSVCMYLLDGKAPSAIYNLGSGKARSFYDLAASTFAAMDRPVQIEFIDIPEDIRDKYQYFTEADMRKLIATGYEMPFTSLEDGVADYVKNYLMPGAYF
jgi:ADP-L-glycero-D-manno-heptose 6-epimerase